MGTINFPEVDLVEMRKLYQEELEKTLRRLEHIKNVLDKISGAGQSVQVQLASEKSEVPKQYITKPVEEEVKVKQFQEESYGTEQEESEETIQPKEKVKERGKRKLKTGPKPVWENLILKRLQYHNRPLTYEELTDDIMAFTNLPGDKRKKTKQAIFAVAFRLRSQKKKVDTFSIGGGKGKYLGLKSWFDSTGTIKEQYKQDLTVRSKTKKNKEKKQKPATESKTDTESNGDKPLWNDYVIEMLQREDRPLLVQTMTEHVMDKFNMNRKYYEKTKLAIARSMTLLDKKYNKVKRHLENENSPGYYGLPDWFDVNGKLRQEYLNKIPHIPNSLEIHRT